MIHKAFLHNKVIESIRKFFAEESIPEFTLPILKPSLPLEPNIYAFSTIWSTPKNKNTFYLSTSPEAELKKILSRGVDSCFSLTKSFRNLEGESNINNKEFIMLEWYRKNYTYSKMMEDSQKLILYVKKKVDKSSSSIITYQTLKIDLAKKWPIYSMLDLFKEHTKISLPNILDISNIKKVAGAKKYTFSKKTSWEQLFDQIFLNEVLPHLPQSPFFIIDYPSQISPLCAPRKDNPEFAQRFELYIGGMEIANGNTENTNTSAVSSAFKKERKKRKTLNIAIPPIDHEFINALDNMKNVTFSGAGLGVERLSMFLTDTVNIKDLYI